MSFPHALTKALTGAAVTTSALVKESFKKESGDGTATAFGMAGLVAGLLALGTDVFALRRSGGSTRA